MSSIKVFPISAMLSHSAANTEHLIQLLLHKPLILYLLSKYYSNYAKTGSSVPVQLGLSLKRKLKKLAASKDGEMMIDAKKYDENKFIEILNVSFD